MEEEISEKEIHLSDYYMVLLKHKALIISFFVITVSITALVTFLMTPVYQSSAKLIIDKESSSSPITGERTNYEDYMSHSMTFNTHFKLITSDPVIESLINTLELDKEGEEDLGVNPVTQVIQQFKDNVKLLLQMEKKDLSPHEKQLALMETVKEKISIDQIRDTRLLTVTVKDKNPGLAADMANTLANKYIEFNLSNKIESSKQTLGWLNNELYEMRKNLEQSEKEFFDYN